MQKFMLMERGPAKFQVGFSVSHSGGMGVLVKITFFISSEYHFPVIMFNQISDRNMNDVTLINTGMCKRIKSQNTKYC
jgi:hypothetical protein